MDFLARIMSTKHRDFDDWLFSLSEEQQGIALRLQSLILSASDGIIISMRYNLPFYDYYGWMVYLNQHKSGMDLSFIQGLHLPDEEGLLEVRKRKQIRSLHYKCASDIKTSDVMRLLYNAMEINKMLRKEKK